MAKIQQWQASRKTGFRTIVEGAGLMVFIAGLFLRVVIVGAITLSFIVSELLLIRVGLKKPQLMDSNSKSDLSFNSPFFL